MFCSFTYYSVHLPLSSSSSTASWTEQSPSSPTDQGPDPAPPPRGSSAAPSAALASNLMEHCFVSQTCPTFVGHLISGSLLVVCFLCELSPYSSFLLCLIPSSLSSSPPAPGELFFSSSPLWYWYLFPSSCLWYFPYPPARYVLKSPLALVSRSLEQGKASGLTNSKKPENY